MAQMTRVSRRAPLWRKVVVGVLVVVGLIVALAGNLTAWTSDTVLDTNTFVAVVEPLPSRGPVARAIGDYVADQVVQAAGPDAPAALRGQVDDVTVQFVQSEDFDTIWATAVRGTHGALRAVLLDKPDVEGVEVVDGKIVLNLDDVVETVRSRLVEAGVSEQVLGELPTDAGRVVIVEESDITEVQQTAETLDTLGIVVPIGAVVLLVAALVLAWGFRRRTLFAIGLGLAIVMAINLIALAAARTLVTDLVEDGDVREASQAAWDVLVSDLRRRSWIILVIGLVIALGAWIAGPSRWATGLRTKVKGVSDRTRSDAEPS